MALHLNDSSQRCTVELLIIMTTKSASRSRPHHQLTSQLEFDFTLGPIKIKDGLFMGDEFAAKVI